MTFIDKKDLLYERALLLSANEDITDKFKRDFFELIGNIIVGMLESEDNFFGSFMIRIERDIRLDITWPLATIPKLNGFLMYFNPILFLRYDKKEMEALFKHEIYHIMYSHHERERSLKDKYSSEAISISIDIAINQFIKNMPMDAKRIDTVSKELDVNLKGNKTIEQYVEIIQKAINERINKSSINKSSDSIVREVDTSKAHKIWEEIDVSDKSIKENIKKISISIKDNKPPEDIMKIIKLYQGQSELKWQEILKHLIPTVRSGYRKTITRRDRRQPERMELRGKLASNIPELVVAVDISASMTDDDIKRIMTEILAIVQNRKANITIIECDNIIRRVYKLRKPQDIQSRCEKNGSTLFTPVFKYMRDNNLRDSILIYFTDGVGEEELQCSPINRNIIWVLTGEEELSLKTPCGVIKKLEKNTTKITKLNSPLEEIRSVINDWAR